MDVRDNRTAGAAGPVSQAGPAAGAGPVVEAGLGRRIPAVQTPIEVAVRLAVLAVLVYWSVTLVRPFVTVAIWSIVLTVALYPVFAWLARQLGGRRRLAAALITVLSLVLVIWPVSWLAMGLVSGVRMLMERLDQGVLTLPPPPLAVKSWPFIGERVFHGWEIASANLKAAFVQAAPYLRPFGVGLVRTLAGAGTFVVQFLVAIIVAGFMFSPGPAMVRTLNGFARRIAQDRGERFVDLAGSTIRAVSRGVIGLAILQSFLTGVGLLIAGVPGANLITFAVLVLGIVQAGAILVLLPVIIWCWTAMSVPLALAWTVYFLIAGFMDNILKPFVMGRGLSTPMLVILIGLIGGTISYGLQGLFLGPIVLAVIWELLFAWIGPAGAQPAGAPATEAATGLPEEA
ncbi:MAG TPA: AI-2E family transporter [Rhodopila sp.]|nr:AI-2E family transporter [Rhodopila sp.]